MCDYITVGVPATKAGVFERNTPRGLIFSRVENASVLEQLPPGWRTYLVTDGPCSCGLHGEPEGVEDEPAASSGWLARKYRKKGWSEAKIRRAIADSERASEQNRPHENFTGLRPDLRDYLQSVLEHTGELAVLVHWYDGCVESERVPVQKVRMSSCSELANLRSDELARISPRWRKR